MSSSNNTVVGNLRDSKRIKIVLTGNPMEIVSFQDDAKYEHVGPKHKGDSRMFKKESIGLHQRKTKVPVTTIKFIHHKERFKDLGTKDKLERQCQRLKINDHYA
ncbi:hypothetical protein Tco_1295586 [Tanacetum coccineum]